jgi:putative membrane protein
MNHLLLTDVLFAETTDENGFLFKVLIILLSVFAAEKVMGKDVQTGGLLNTFLLAIVIVILNQTLGAVLNFVTAPFNWITLGLVSLLVNALIIRIADSLFSKFKLKSFWTAFWMAVIISIVTMIVNKIW